MDREPEILQTYKQKSKKGYWDASQETKQMQSRFIYCPAALITIICINPPLNIVPNTCTVNTYLNKNHSAIMFEEIRFTKKRKKNIFCSILIKICVFMKLAAVGKWQRHSRERTERGHSTLSGLLME